MKKETIDREPLTIKREIIFDFEAKIDYETFCKKYIEDTLSFTLTISNEGGLELEDAYRRRLKALHLVFGYQYEKIDNFSYKINSIEYLLGKIFESNAFLSLDTATEYTLRKLFRYTVEDVYSAKQLLPQIALNSFKRHLGENTRENMDYMFLRFIKYNSYQKSKNFSGLYLDDSIERTYKLFKNNPLEGLHIYRKIHCSINEYRKLHIEYLIFCSTILGKDLYMIYNGIDEYNILTVIDETKIGYYTGQGCIIRNISNVIKEVFGKFLSIEKNTIQSINKEDTREKLFSDIKELSKKGKQLHLQIKVKDELPEAMDGKRSINDPNLYKEVKEYIGNFGEVTQVVNRGKVKIIKAKKQFSYKKTLKP